MAHAHTLPNHKARAGLMSATLLTLGYAAQMKRISLLAIGLAVSGCAGWLGGPAMAQSPHTHGHSFADSEKWAKVFDDPKRDAWQKPHEVIQTLALRPDAVIADIGTGTGYFAVRFAHMVPKGKVYGVDTEPPAQVKAEMQKAGYAVDREHAFLPNQYFLVFRPAAP